MRLIAESCGCFWGRRLASRHESRNFPTNDEADDLLPTCSRPIKVSAIVQPSPTGDPEGGAQDAHRFSMRQDASSKNPGFAADGRFGLDLNVFFGDFLCAKESYPRKARKLCYSTVEGYRYFPKTLDSTYMIREDTCMKMTLRKAGIGSFGVAGDGIVCRLPEDSSIQRLTTWFFARPWFRSLSRASYFSLLVQRKDNQKKAHPVGRARRVAPGPRVSRGFSTAHPCTVEKRAASCRAPCGPDPRTPPRPGAPVDQNQHQPPVLPVIRLLKVRMMTVFLNA